MAIFNRHLEEFGSDGLSRQDLLSEEFGLDREDLFGADEDPDADDLDSTLDSFEAEIDKDLAAYGAWYGTEAAVAETYDAPDLDALRKAVDIGAVLPTQLQGGYFEGFYEWYRDRALGDEALEIARRLSENLSRFSNWPNLSAEDKREIVKVAVVQSAIPGIDLSADDVIRNAVEPEVGVVNKMMAAAGATPQMALRYFTSDFPRTVGAMITEIPVLGPLYEDYWKALGITKRESADQAINALAMMYVAMSWLGLDVYGWIADKIDTEYLPQSLQPTGEVTEFVAIEEGAVPVGPPLPEPTEYAERRGGFPSPEVILAFGYGLTALGAITGVLR